MFSVCCTLGRRLSLASACWRCWLRLVRAMSQAPRATRPAPSAYVASDVGVGAASGDGLCWTDQHAWSRSAATAAADESSEDHRHLQGLVLEWSSDAPRRRIGRHGQDGAGTGSGPARSLNGTAPPAPVKYERGSPSSSKRTIRSQTSYSRNKWNGKRSSSASGTVRGKMIVKVTFRR